MHRHQLIFLQRKSWLVKCCLYKLLELAEGSAEASFQAICKVLEKDKIPLSNVIGFAADTTNVMFGQHNSVVSHLQQAVPSSGIAKSGPGRARALPIAL